MDLRSVIDQAFVGGLLQDPNRLYSLDPRRFEELIAEVFAAFGFAVELTQRTRDGGRDVVAISHNIVRVKYLVECKRYSPDRKVVLGVVQRLHGVTASEGATKGILATTSWLTQPAQRHVQLHEWLLEARDFDGLVDWLRRYQVLRLQAASRVDNSMVGDHPASLTSE